MTGNGEHTNIYQLSMVMTGRYWGMVYSCCTHIAVFVNLWLQKGIAFQALPTGLAPSCVAGLQLPPALSMV